MSNRFTNEEKESKWGYYSGYEKPKSVEDQIDILRSHWPDLDPDPALKYYREVYSTLTLPGWVEGPFVILPPMVGEYYEELGRLHRADDRQTDQLFGALARDRGRALHIRRDQFDPHDLMWVERTNKFRALKKGYPGDLLIIPAQFGVRHRGRSVRRARRMFDRNEVGLDLNMVATMLLTHPERLQHHKDLSIDCAGSGYDPVSHRYSLITPNFHVGLDGFDDNVYAGLRWSDQAKPYSGSVTCFLHV